MRMKSTTLATAMVAAVALLFLSGPSLNSQAPQTASGTLLSQLQAIQTANKALIEKQQKTLQSLDEMKATAEQLKALGKRG